MVVNVNLNTLKNLIRETLREVIVSEFMKLKADLMPFVSDKEQKEIERKYGKPSRKIAKRVKVKLEI